VQHLPGLFPNPSAEPPTGSLAAPQVVPGRDKGTHERDPCWRFSRAAAQRQLPPRPPELNGPSSPSPRLQM
jgi:hypothetical protein